MSDPIKRGIRTAIQTFIAAFSVSLFGWLADVQEWAGSANHAFPSVNPLGKAAAGALVAVVSGSISYAINLLEDRRVIPSIANAEKPEMVSEGPIDEPRGDRGMSDVAIVLLILAVLVLVLVLTGRL